MSEAAPEKTSSTVVVGRYALFGEIAAGGMATVHFGRLLGPIGFSRPVAIKRLHPQLARDPSVRAMFVDEARLAARISHPNVVQTLDVIHEGDELLLVMDYVHGESLGKIARATRKAGEQVPAPITVAIVSNLLHGLHAAHEAKTEDGQPLQIVHRDVSPQNVLVGSDGIARVLDFGIARAEVRLESTREGIVKGKLAYMAPEQLLGTPITRSADLFAAGVVLWELLAGKRLLLRGDEGEHVLIEKLLRGDFEPPSRWNRSLDPALDAIAMRALEREPDARFATARDMALALERAAPMATATQVGEWVERFAGEALAERLMKLSEFERSSARLRTATGNGSDYTSGNGDRSSGSLNGHLGNTLDPPLPVTVRPPVKVSPARASLWGIAVVSLGFAVGGAGLATAFHAGRVGPGAAVDAITPVSLPAAPIVKPTCPLGTQTIPGGHFFMGSDDDLEMERPAHEVTLAPYCIDTFEVTTSSFRACSDRGECKRAGVTNEWDGISDLEHKTYDPLCNVRDPSARRNHPINCVDWEMATLYCKAQGKRLPTEAEWEFAARGPDGRKYPWGDEAPSPTLLNACGKECLAWGKKNRVELQAMFAEDDGYATTAPVGSFPKGASRYGVQDVVGNVWEWVSDVYAPYTKEDQTNPKGAESGDEHVIRGGAWNGAYPAWVRPTFRYKDAAEKRSYGIGFRCAKSL